MSPFPAQPGGSGSGSAPRSDAPQWGRLWGWALPEVLPWPRASVKHFAPCHGFRVRAGCPGHPKKWCGDYGGGGWSWSMRRLRGHPGAAVAARSPGSDPGGGGAAGVPCGMGTQDELPLSQPHCCPPLPRAGPCAGALPQGRAALPRQRGCAAAGSEHWHRPGEGHNTPPPPPPPMAAVGKGAEQDGEPGA